MYLKQGDLYPSLIFDTNADVSGATASAFIRLYHQDTVVEKVLSLLDAPTGVLEYQWLPGDTDVPGTYEVHAKVTFASGLVQTFPQTSKLELIILPMAMPVEE
jgi:hypothetical protein